MGVGSLAGFGSKPYGLDAQFVRECTGCHRPMRANDYVYTLPITRALARRSDVVNNSAAALPESLPYQPLSWNAITMYVAPATHITAVLYGNDAAIGSIRAHRGTTHGPAYATGAVLALVTWAQREDPHWFGARIPSEPQSVEFVQVQAAQKNEYRRFAGPGLTEDRPSADISAQRTNHLLDLAPALLPFFGLAFSRLQHPVACVTSAQAPGRRRYLLASPGSNRGRSGFSETRCPACRPPSLLRSGRSRCPSPRRTPSASDPATGSKSTMTDLQHRTLRRQIALDDAVGARCRDVP